MLHESDHGLWRDWLAAAGARDLVLGPGLIMDDPNVLHQAAVEGQGVALGAEALLDGEISQGRLIRPFERWVEMDGGYYLVHPPSARANVQAFCDWLAEEAHAAAPPHPDRNSLTAASRSKR